MHAYTIILPQQIPYTCKKYFFLPVLKYLLQTGAFATGCVVFDFYALPVSHPNGMVYLKPALQLFSLIQSEIVLS